MLVMKLKGSTITKVDLQELLHYYDKITPLVVVLILQQMAVLCNTICA